MTLLYFFSLVRENKQTKKQRKESLCFDAKRECSNVKTVEKKLTRAREQRLVRPHGNAVVAAIFILILDVVVEGWA
jgi:hypothetical protein